MADITKLKQTRGTIKATLTNIKKFAEDRTNEAIENQSSVNNEQINTRIEKLERAWNEFHELSDAIAVASNISQQTEIDAFEDSFYETEAMLKRLLKARVSIIPHVDNNANTSGQFTRSFIDLDRSVIHSDIRLPRIQIQAFDGNYSEWPSFFDQYVKAIHNNESMINVTKFQYLKTLLKGEAGELVRHLPITEESYVEAWEKLLKRYDRKKNIVKDYIELFMSQPNMNQPTSTKTLRSICDTTDQALRGIRSLGSVWEGRDPWLLYIILKKLDPEIQHLWAIHSNEFVTPTINQLLEFITNRCDALECTTVKQPCVKVSRHEVKLHAVTSSETQVNSCAMCKYNHPLFRCFNFKRLKPNARRKFVINNNLCENCLRSGHSVNDCTSDRKCFICSEKHNTLIHIQEHPTNQVNQRSIMSSSVKESNACVTNQHTFINNNDRSSSTSNNTNDNPSTETSVSYVGKELSSRALLSTVQCCILDENNQLHKVRGLLDSGSQTTLITESLAQRIAIKRLPTSCTVSGLASKAAISARGSICLPITSMYSNAHMVKVDALILPKLTTQIPASQVNKSRWDVINNLKLADPDFSTPGHIDIILGNDVFLEILLPEKFIIQPNLIAQHTIFGWVIGGKIFGAETSNELQILHTTTRCQDEMDVVEKFWQIEEVGTQKQTKPEDGKCEEIFKRTTYRESDGRFAVRLPFKESPEVLGLSYYHAERRQLSMERKFAKDTVFAKQYHDFMLEYSRLGHMQLVPESEIRIDTPHFYLPHHAVCKEDSTTTKLHVVFDGSCKSSSSASINEVLLQGPVLQDDLTSILLRFRFHSIAMSADIEKMYRQVNLQKEDTEFQRIIWRSNASERINHYRLTTVTYGITSAPFLAIRSMLELKTIYENEFPVASSILQRDFYVDDMLTGCEDEKSAETIYNQISQLLKRGGFSIRKWMSNCLPLMNIIPLTERATADTIPLDDQPTFYKTLGLHWAPSRDCFQYNIKSNANSLLTKRNLLSEASRVFDPLGLVTPITIKFKILFQQVWKRKLDWDQLLPDDISREWKSIKSSLPVLQLLKVERCIKLKSSVRLELHIFCDASQLGYGAAAYLRSEDSNHHVAIRLVIAKSRVAPIKLISIPRLELCAAELGTKLYTFIDRAMRVSFNDVFAGTDSKVVLAWLAGHPSRWKPFVAHRTTKIQNCIPFSSWNYVESKLNPADHTSRGLTPQQLLDNQLWWSGPEFLMHPKSQWPVGKPLEEDYIPEERKFKVLSSQSGCTTKSLKIASNMYDQLFIRCSSLQKIFRIISYVCRFYIHRCCKSFFAKKNIRKSNQVKITPPTPIEMEIAENICIRWAQFTAFNDEVKALQTHKDIRRSSKLLDLSPFLDENKILRVGGRLSNADCGYNVKHPIILPKEHCFAKYVIRNLHLSNCHVGANTLMSIIRQRYWIVGGRNMIRYYILQCIPCFKLRQHQNNQIMGNLPKYRVTPGRVFMHTGVDYAGPIWIRDRSGRGPFKPIKGYIALFVCTRVKAIHIEVVSSLTTEAFIMALQRFISKRGKPTVILSDNGSNFVGAKRELGNLFELFKSESHFELVSKFLTPQKIQFKFIPARSPHFGGLWEVNIKSYKHLLLSSTGTAPLTFEQLYTVSAEIEAILNSRPICAQSESFEDFDALTPGHFLVGAPLTSLPEPFAESLTMNRLPMYQNIQKRVDIFWKRWSKDYLTSLQKRQKWKSPQSNIKLNQLVMLREDNLPKATWLIGRIIEVYPGNDTKVRVAKVKTPKGEFTRSIVKLVPLPIDE